MSTAPTVGSYPLTPLQRGMLFHHLSESGTGVEVLQVVGRLRERLDVDRLVAAWKEVAARHEPFRTSFRWEGVAEPLQEVHADVDIEVDRSDWRKLDPHERSRLLETLLDDDRARGFDLSRAPLWRLHVVQEGDAEWRLVWTHHHIVLDGRSELFVLEEVFALYRALASGERPPLPEPASFRDHVAWLGSLDFRASEGFWRSTLAGFAQPTPLPLAREVPTGRRGYAERERWLGTGVSDRLHGLAREHRLSLATLVQAAWALLLARYTGRDDVVFGLARSGRYTGVPGADRMVGNLINTGPVRVRVNPEQRVADWLQELRAWLISSRDHEHVPLVNVQEWSEIASGTPLYETVIIFDNYLLDLQLKRRGEEWRSREFKLIDQTSLPLNLYAYGEDPLLLKLCYRRDLFDEDAIDRMLAQLDHALSTLAEHVDEPLGALTCLPPDEATRVLVEWNATGAEPAGGDRIERLIEAQAAAEPEATALIAPDETLTFGELDARASRLAARLRDEGVGRGDLAGIAMDRSASMVVGLLAILKAGAAYVPLDVHYPRERLAFMVEDSGMRVVLARSGETAGLGDLGAPILAVGGLEDGDPLEDDAASSSDELAYVLYTSGSTGRPKGVMVTHDNVLNFFAGMDEHVPHAQGDVWLAVTSISFDISVLELFWTLSRGLTVVLHPDVDRAAAAASPDAGVRACDFSLFYFAGHEPPEASDKYRLLLEGARFGDEHGFSAVWTPERHFHAFGGLYPNPSVVGAAVAAVTERIGIRAGSVVLPLQNPIRVAEEWSVVDNLSGGRVGVSFASGWQANDFVLAPGRYADRIALMYEEVELVRALWRGEPHRLPDGAGTEIDVRIHPRPVQDELPVWITSGGNIETFRSAGRIGANLLTHLLGQDVDQLARKIGAYRRAFADAGHEGDGYVTLMMHAFCGDSLDEVRAHVQRPFIDYLKTSSGLVMGLAKSLGHDLGSEAPSAEEMDEFLRRRFDRYFERSGLMGTPDGCRATIRRLVELGVDDIACLIDFGVEHEAAMASLERIAELKEDAPPRAPAPRAMEGPTLAEQVSRHGVTHLQCTPSLARILLADADPAALTSLRHLLIGGEAFPPALARELESLVPGATIHNMYGPTETTIWSSTDIVRDGDVTIGRPIANTTLFVLDAGQRPVPIGVAGELYIGGRGVARGYWRREELTAERFVEVGSVGGSTLFRTGDLVRYRADGRLDFLGRLDHQVKIRGHRIELGEIEARLTEHVSVRESVVLAREDRQGDQRLVGYAIAEPGRRPSSAELRSWLRERLPEPMVPAAIVLLDAFPLTPNKKIDRQALPAPETAETVAAAAHVEPEGETELAMAAIWCEVLSVDRIGAEDDFFDLGGHSLLAIQLLSAVREHFHVRLPLSSLFSSPTVRGLAGAADRALIGEAEAEDVEEALRDLDDLSDDDVRRMLDEMD